jgi:hypothetical protein
MLDGMARYAFASALVAIDWSLGSQSLTNSGEIFFSVPLAISIQVSTISQYEAAA